MLLEQLDLTGLIALAAVMAFSGLVHGTLGLGFPLVSTPLIALMVDVRTAILLTLLPTVAVNVASIIGGKGYGDSLKRFWPLAVSALLSAMLGAWLLAWVDPHPFKLILALLILLFLWATYTQRVPTAFMACFPVTAMLVFGVASGFAAGTTNVMVAVLIIYFLAIDLPRPTMVPIMNTCFGAGKIAQLIVLSVAGLVSWSLVIHTLPLAVIAVGALTVGQRLSQRIPVATYKRVLHALLAVMAALLIYQFATGLTF